MYNNSMMEEEIDIEEHDVLDNPRIKHMFPDLTKVKTEALEEEEIGEFSEEEYIHVNDYLQYENSFNHSEYDYYNEMEENADTDNCTNKIILGSKPSAEKIEEEAVKKEYLPTVVMLEDWGERLNNSSCFCKDCKILFATDNALDYHKMATHSFLVAITNKAVKSTAKNSTIHIKSVDNIEDGTVTPEMVGEDINVEKNKLCNHCNKYFPDGNALIKHLYELLTKDDVSETKEPMKTSNFNYHCRICQKPFLSHSAGKIHITTVHPEVNVNGQLIKMNEGSEKTNGDLKMATRNVSKSKTSPDSDISLNYWYSKRMFIKNPPIPQSVLFKCLNCSVHFVMPLSATYHRRHCSENKQFLKCEICKRNMRSHDILLHELQHKVSTGFKIYPGSSRNYKKSLCKCPKCSVCFWESKFWLHYKQCSGKQLECDWCAVCGEFIHSHIIMVHMNMHSKAYPVKDDFIIIKFVTDVNSKVEENVERIVTSKKKGPRYGIVAPLKKNKKLINNSNKKDETFHLYYCKICNCCIHKNRWDSHLASNCRKAKSIVCQKCGLTFTRKSVTKHRALHEHYYNVSLHNFEFFSRDGSRTVPKAPRFHHCPKCRVYFITKTQRKFHECGEKYEICHICKKKYNLLAYKLHAPFHTYGKIDKTVKPEITDIPIKPDNKDVRIKPEEDEPDSVKNYNYLNIMWNILFLCESCGLNTDSYDEAVNHSQSHLTGSTDASEQARCKVCDLKFDFMCYKSHLQLHRQLPVNKKDFLILPYRYRALFKNQWFNLFGKLAPKKIQQIISQSIYRDTRRANMRIVKNGRADYTLYVCKLCSVCVKGQDVNKHTRSLCSQIDHDLHCSYCDIFFDIADHYKHHVTIHTQINVDFRVVEFEPMASPKQLSGSLTNTVVVAKEKFFVFNKCAYCKLSVLGKGIKKMKHVCCDGVQITCKLCGLRYRPKYRNNHMRLHEKYPMLSRKTVKCQLFHPEKRKTVIGHPSGTGNNYSAPVNGDKLDVPCKNVLERLESVENDRLLTSKIYLVTCRTCRLVFKSRRELTAHYSKCVGKRNETVKRADQMNFILYKCSKCPCHFLHRRSVTKHKDMCSSLRRPLCTCEICGLEFTQISLKRHMSQHHFGEKYTFKIIEYDSGEVLVHSV